MKNHVTSFIYPVSLLSFSMSLILVFSPSRASAQTTEQESAKADVVSASTPSTQPASNVPVLKDYRGVTIGMSAKDVREKLDRLKDGGPLQDFFLFSDKESAQIYYDKDRKVIAISVDYFGGDNEAPSPTEVLGEELHAKPDGSMYQLKRYPDAGYWVSYNRTAGEKPIITITMQKT